MRIDLDTTAFNFLDLETTGFSAKSNRIIEVYASKIIDGRVIDNFHSLVNPETLVSRDIIYLTSIPVSELQFAPTFDQISIKLMAFLGDDIIVAHNARFDIGFLRSEFARLGMAFKNQYCCTVKISRFLYPDYRKHGLNQIIDRLGIDEDLLAGLKTGRHRADYDTEVIRVFFYKSLEKFGRDTFTKALDHAMKTRAKPTNMPSFNFDTIPSSPGVYIFYGENKSVPLYVGMSKDLKRRVFDHLYNSTTYDKDLDITNQVKEITTIETAGVLGAKLRESELIKSLMPLYNKKLRKSTENCKYKIVLDENGYYNLAPAKKMLIDFDEINSQIDLIGGEKFIQLMLNEYIKKFGLCAKLLGLEQNTRLHSNKPCFYYHLGQCKGACIQEITAQEYNENFNEAFSRFKIKTWPYAGQIEYTEESETMRETFYIDNWCLIGSSMPDLDNQIKQKGKNKVFDRDIYQILKPIIK